MRILSLVNTDRPTPVSDFALELASEAGLRGHEMMLVALVRDRETPRTTPLGELADDRGVFFRLLHQRRRFDPGILGQLEMMFRRLKPDLFQSHDLKGMALYWIARWKPRYWQAFVHPAASGGSQPNSLLSAALEKKLLRRADQVIADAAIEKPDILRRGAREERLLMLAREGPAEHYWKRTILDEAERLTGK